MYVHLSPLLSHSPVLVSVVSLVALGRKLAGFNERVSECEKRQTASECFECRCDCARGICVPVWERVCEVCMTL